MNSSQQETDRFINQKTWAPRGEFTARVLYNISRGWVTHNEVRFLCRF